MENEIFAGKVAFVTGIGRADRLVRWLGYLLFSDNAKSVQASAWKLHE
jgi:hypothetical protein